MTTTINADNVTGGAVVTGDSSGELGLQTAGTTRMTITSAGNVGIGTTSPESNGASYTTLSLNNATNGGVLSFLKNNVRQALIFNTNDGGLAIEADVVTNSRIMFYTAGASERMRIDSSGNVGIGTSSPVAADGSAKTFQVGDRSIIQSTVGTQTTISNNAYYDGTWKRAVTGYATAVRLNGLGATGDITFTTAASGSAGSTLSTWDSSDIKMVITNAGNVGIGTSSPGAKLDVNAGGTALAARIQGTNSPYLSVLDNDNTVEALVAADGAGYSIFGSVTNHAAVFRTNNAERMRIDTSGNVSINTSSASLSGATSGLLVQRSGLEILGINNGNNSNQSWIFAINDSGLGNAGRLSICQVVNGSTAGIAGGPAVPIISAEIPTTANATPRLYINAGGEVLAGGTTDNGAYNLQCNGTGVWGAGAYVNGSDARIKEDVAPIQSGLDVVAKLNPVTFRYKESWSKDQNIQPGFIAQELQTAMVDEVYVDGVVQQGPEYMSVAYQSLIPILTKAIQEQQQQIDALKAEVAALKGE